MKKFLCLVLALVLAMSVFVACGKNDEQSNVPASGESEKTEMNTPAEDKVEETEAPAESGKPAQNKPAKKPAKSDVPAAATPAPSTNKEVVTEGSAPDVYLAVDSDDNATSISYHLKGCGLLKGTNPQKVAWDMVKTLGFRQCPKCNPPRYEGYIE